MADNVTVDNNSLTDYVVAADDDGTAQHQYVKLEYGADGTFTKVSTANPLPSREQTTATATVTSVADSASSISLLASTAGRIGATFFNDSTEILYLKYGATASLTSFTVRIDPLGFFEMPAPVYTGDVDGIWANNASGSVRITELT